MGLAARWVGWAVLGIDGSDEILSAPQDSRKRVSEWDVASVKLC